MFKSLYHRLGFGEKKPNNKPKHRLIVSIPSTRYEDPSTISEKNKKKLKSKKKSNNNQTSSNNLTKLNTSLPMPINIKKRYSLPNKISSKKKLNKKNISNKQTINVVRSRTPKRKNIKKKDGYKSENNININNMNGVINFMYGGFDVINKNNGLKFEITVQYQQQMWTVYKTLYDFISLYNVLVRNYNGKVFRDVMVNKKTKEKKTKVIEIPPLLPIGLFYLYFDEKYNKNAIKNEINEKENINKNGYNINQKNPMRVYKQIYSYHQQQQMMIQKKQNNNNINDEKQKQNINQNNKNNEIMNNILNNNKNSLSDASNNIVHQYNNQQQQPILINNKSIENSKSELNNLMPYEMRRKYLINNNSEKESPFLNNIRISLQIWLRVICDDSILTQCNELSSFIQFKWKYQSNTLTNSPNNNNNNKSNTNSNKLLNINLNASMPQLFNDGVSDFNQSFIVGGSHSPNINDTGTNADGTENNNDSPKKPSLSDFTLLKVVGKGAFGKVLQVRHISSNIIYAMKVLKKENVIKRNQIEHTKTERRVLGNIKHPFIVKLSYAFQTETKLYFVLNYAAGGELFFHLGKVGKFKENRAKFYAAEITLALEFLHSKDIIYRDLKPENVLLDCDGHVNLTDFGLSKEKINDDNLAHSFCGTPEYLAPEILRRSGHGKPSDWWSLGALLYEMLTGLPPFYSRDRDRLFDKILHSKLRFPNYFSDAAVNILTLLMQRNWKKRLGSYISSNPSKYENDPKKKTFALLKGADQVKRHIFFKDIEWNKLLNKQIKPPFIPKIILDKNTNAQGTTNFDPEFTQMAIYSDDENPKNRNFDRNSSKKRNIKRKYLLSFESFTYEESHSDNAEIDNDNEQTSTDCTDDTDEDSIITENDEDGDITDVSEDNDINDTNNKSF